MAQHCHGEEISKEVLYFRARVNPHRIIAKESGKLSNIAKTPPPKFKEICQRLRLIPTNLATLFNLHSDKNIKTLG